jgi:hypothetical protein
MTLRLFAGRCENIFLPQPERNLSPVCRFLHREQAKKVAPMTKSFPAVALRVVSGALVLSAPLLLGACAPAPAPPPPCDACAAMSRANEAYALAQQAENDAQAAKVAASTMYQRTLHK